MTDRKLHIAQDAQTVAHLQKGMTLAHLNRAMSERATTAQPAGQQSGSGATQSRNDAGGAGSVPSREETK